MNFDYLHRTWIYVLMIAIPIIATLFICFAIDNKKTYSIITKEIQPHGEYFLTLGVQKNGQYITYKTVETTGHNFYRVSRGKISKKIFEMIERGDKI